MMRIITGCARGVSLFTLPGEATRPTSERAKQAIFSMLQFELENRRVLDLFAGSGQMGLEAVSRGAKSAVFVDQSKDAVQIIRQNIEKTRLTDRCTVYTADFADFARRMRGKEPFDFVFMDPPYAMHACETACAAILDNRLLSPDGCLICESEEPDPIRPDGPLSGRLRVRKTARYGRACITLLCRSDSAARDV